MISVYDNIKEDCSGCLACKNICPVKAINVTKDNLEFNYPIIDQDKCIDCLLCKKVCPLVKDMHLSNIKIYNDTTNELYACKSNSNDVLKQSTSGGMFTSLSDYFINTNNVVYGVIFDDNYNVIHARATTKQQRDKMRFSKYVQTDLDKIYPAIKEDLNNDKLVLFTGTPCQCAGIKSYFSIHPKYSNLYIVDVICHSIPSPKFFKDYKKLIEDEHSGKIQHLQFRSKKYPWLRTNSNKGFLYTINNKTYEDGRFFKIFTLAPYAVRDSCFNCQFTSLNRVSDITIADYWGIEDFDTSLYDPLGVSSLFVNNTKGLKLFNLINSTIQYNKRNIQEQLATQKRLSTCSIRPDDQTDFLNIYFNKGIKAAFNYLENKKQ
ncbi:Coenzyme F420 hydrogenase/dehydrogenase, beta subunit C-terminal domain [Mycoplasma sp. P36-A1]|uniref:Coenzyme F420 hydrogenase/dehydrogenase, beta subunit C-terminal domain n=1 Tax=Mycoplasma sp. P36-A1 TaxID=3252900 RepID=UPI003C2E480D